ncbi:oxygenase MpaB family protein [Nocardiopsis ansamitocini]|uniref:Peptidase n=1 Tax=Nocardiopsis ansamitocini TaxID=1670832 RepID=A0A9W6UKG9_9ACTN|nr:oxygenase MpaB family protein [Nocardiopsis ansamitocini]GLU49727.1 peptidase [Nocardiopsis ansamitocini]
MKRFDWYDEIHRLDADTDCQEIVRILVAHEFPWDMSKSLGMALFRTYAVPGIGGLLGATREFTGRTQHRYDDTALIMGEMIRHGFGPGRGRDALRRMNQMHRSYDISNDDYRYVLSTFAVMPVRWLNDLGYGWRKLTDHEIIAHTNFYRDLGRHMGIKEIPADYAGFAELLDTYEREHFAYSEGGRAVADTTLELMVGFFPARVRWAVEPFTKGLMDAHLLEALRYPRASWFWRSAGHRALRLRSRIVRFMPPRVEPFSYKDNPNIISYPDGFEPSRIGTFPTGCPVPHDMITVEIPETGSRVPAPDQALSPQDAGKRA